MVFAVPFPDHGIIFFPFFFVFKNVLNAKVAKAKETDDDVGWHAGS